MIPVRGRTGMLNREEFYHSNYFGYSLPIAHEFMNDLLGRYHRRPAVKSQLLLAVVGSTPYMC